MSFVYDKILPYDNPQVTWCQTMDLIGIISSSERLIEVHRCGYKHFKVFSKEDSVQPTSVVILENGKYCAVGYDDGRISILKTDSGQEIFQTKIVDLGQQISCLSWHICPQGEEEDQDSQMLQHLKSIEQLDSKLKGEVKEKLYLLKDETTLSMLYAADTAGNISILLNGSFPISSFNLKQVIFGNNQQLNNVLLKVKQLKSTQNCQRLLCHVNIHNSETSHLIQSSFISILDTRVLESRFLSNSFYKRALNNLQLLEENIKFLDTRVDVCKSYWKTFFKSFTQIMKLQNPSIKTANPYCDELIDFIVKGKITLGLQKYLCDELYNCKILSRLDENCQLIMGNVQEELSDKMLPTIQQTILLLSELRGQVKSKQNILGQQLQMMYLGLNESLIQKMIDFSCYYFYQVEQLCIDVVKTKVDLRNLFLFLNFQVIKLSQSSSNNNQDIENTKSHLAKLSTSLDTNSLLKFLEKGDQNLFLTQFSKIFEEGQYKLPIDSENEIVQQFQAEDLIYQIQKLDQSENVPMSQSSIHISPINTSQVQATKRVTRRSHISNDYSRSKNSAIGGSRVSTANIQQSQQQASSSGSSCIIPLKTLSTRILDLIHKQMRKPLESLSPYYRNLGIINFENSKDRVLDTTIRSEKGILKASLIVNVEGRFLVFFSFEVFKQPLKGAFPFTFWVLEIPQNMDIVQGAFHVDTFQNKPESEEQIMLLISNEGQTVDGDESQIAIVDLKKISEENVVQASANIDQSGTFRFSEWAREVITKALAGKELLINGVPTVTCTNNIQTVPIQKLEQQEEEEEESKFTFVGLKSKNVSMLSAGQKGLFSVILDQRKLTIFLNQKMDQPSSTQA